MTPQESSNACVKLCSIAPVIPVLVIQDVATALPLAQALVAGGLPVLEVTLRTPAALDAIHKMKTVEGSIVGAGTLLTPADVFAAKKAGAQFGVSPGATDALLDACEQVGLPLLPGATTASEIMRLYERGYQMLKFFPAEASGGVPVLKTIGGPIPQVNFCPTGGITLKNAPLYLALKNVICVGSSWVASNEKMTCGDWEGITATALAASSLPRLE